MPVTVVPTSLATVAMDTFMTELSRVIRNCPAAKVPRTSPVPLAGAWGVRVFTASASIPSPPHLRSADAWQANWHLPVVEHGTPQQSDWPPPVRSLVAEDQSGRGGPECWRRPRL